jgi:hypothetical protein
MKLINFNDSDYHNNTIFTYQVTPDLTCDIYQANGNKGCQCILNGTEYDGETLKEIVKSIKSDY